MNKLIVFLIMAIVISILGYILLDNTFENKKAVPTIQYSKPIGATKTPPYRLPSEVLFNG